MSIVRFRGSTTRAALVSYQTHNSYQRYTDNEICVIELSTMLEKFGSGEDGPESNQNTHESQEYAQPRHGIHLEPHVPIHRPVLFIS